MNSKLLVITLFLCGSGLSLPTEAFFSRPAVFDNAIEGARNWSALITITAVTAGALATQAGSPMVGGFCFGVGGVSACSTLFWHYYLTRNSDYLKRNKLNKWGFPLSKKVSKRYLKD